MRLKRKHYIPDTSRFGSASTLSRECVSRSFAVSLVFTFCLFMARSLYARRLTFSRCIARKKIIHSHHVIPCEARTLIH